MFLLSLNASYRGCSPQVLSCRFSADMSRLTTASWSITNLVGEKTRQVRACQTLRRALSDSQEFRNAAYWRTDSQGLGVGSNLEQGESLLFGPLSARSLPVREGEGLLSAKAGVGGGLTLQYPRF